MPKAKKNTSHLSSIEAMYPLFRDLGRRMRIEVFYDTVSCLSEEEQRFNIEEKQAEIYGILIAIKQGMMPLGMAVADYCMTLERLYQRSEILQNHGKVPYYKEVFVKTREACIPVIKTKVESLLNREYANSDEAEAATREFKKFHNNVVVGTWKHYVSQEAGKSSGAGGS